MIRKVVGEKVCSRCKKNKSFDDFHRRKSQNAGKGLYTWCKECHAEYQKQAREPKKKESNKRIFELKKIRRLEIEKAIVKHLKITPCKECGETNILVLEFDHREPKEKKFCISHALQQVPSLLRLQIEISKCDILCSNCHKIKTALDNNNFKLKYMAT